MNPCNFMLVGPPLRRVHFNPSFTLMNCHGGQGRSPFAARSAPATEFSVLGALKAAAAAPGGWMDVVVGLVVSWWLMGHETD